MVSTREWAAEQRGESNIDRWQYKIRHLRQFLRGWAKNNSGVYRKEKEILLKIINDLHIKAESTSLDMDERVNKREAEVSLTKLLREEKLKWALRAKVRQVVQGDNNTQFFHMIANGKHRKKRIIQLEQDEGTIVGHENLKMYISNY